MRLGGLKNIKPLEIRIFSEHFISIVLQLEIISNEAGVDSQTKKPSISVT